MGQLRHGKLTVEEGKLKGTADGCVEFMFNPAEYSISKSNTWNLKAAKGSNVPNWEFGGGEPRTLSLELFFDSYLQKDTRAVHKLTNRLFNFMMVDTSLKGGKSKMGQPPKCRLAWGADKDQFDCYITSCQVKYTMFDDQGLPVRATATLSLKEDRDATKLLPTNPTSVGEPGRRLWVVSEGDRLDWIAYQEYGDAKQWRRIAEANRLSDPLDLPPGITLAIPPL